MVGLPVLLRDVQREAVAIEQLQSLPEIGKPHASLVAFSRRAPVDAVHAVETELALLHAEPYLHEGGTPIAYTVLEGVLDDADEQQGRQEHVFPVAFRQFEADTHLPAGIALAHQFHVAGDEVRLLVQGCTLFRPLVKHVAHEFRQLHDHHLRLGGLHLHHPVYIIEHVHEKMRVDLRLEMFQFVPQVCGFQPACLLLLLLVAGKEGDGQVEAQHQGRNHEIQQQGHGHSPVPRAVSGRTGRTRHRSPGFAA